MIRSEAKNPVNDLLPQQVFPALLSSPHTSRKLCQDIAEKLNRTELNVQSCTAWIVHFLDLKSWHALILYSKTSAAIHVSRPIATNFTGQ